MIKLRQWLFDLLERPQVMPVRSANVNRFLIGLIFFNIGAAILESVPEFSQSYASTFLLIESVSIAITLVLVSMLTLHRAYNAEFTRLAGGTIGYKNLEKTSSLHSLSKSNNKLAT